MKAVAASSIGQYEKSVRAWADYYRTVQLGLGACFREGGPAPWSAERKRPRVAGAIGAVVCSSDQGLGGPFNGVVADHVGGGTAGRVNNFDTTWFRVYCRDVTLPMRELD